MTDRTAVPERVSQRAKRTRHHRGDGSGSQAVGDYVGRPAGEVAQAVRRAGLRPGLDRTFGCPAELIGLVVAQDPVAGSDLARNGMVTLYVAAPGGEPLDDDTGVSPSGDGASDRELAAPEPIEDAPSQKPPMPVRPRRRRKQGHACRPAAPLEPAPPPTVQALSPDPSAMPTVESPPPAAAWPSELDAPDGALEDELAGELGEREFPHDDEFVVHIDDVLAGRSGPPGWRRVYPRRRAAMGALHDGARLRVWLGEHRMLAGVLSVALVLWLVVGVASTLQGEHARSSAPASALASNTVLGAKRPDPPPRPMTARKLSAHETALRSSRPHPARRAPRAAPTRCTPRPSPRPSQPAAVPVVSEALLRAAAKEAPAPREAPTPTQAPAPQPAEAPAPRASTPPAPALAPERSGGGLFSP